MKQKVGYKFAPPSHRRFRSWWLALVPVAMLSLVALVAHVDTPEFASQGKASKASAEQVAVALTSKSRSEANHPTGDCSIDRPNDQDVCSASAGRYSPVEVPEPAMLLLVGTGLLSIAALVRSRIS